MNFVADENVDRPLAEELRRRGHSVEYILDTSRGAPDGQILARSTASEAILITSDGGFGELIYRQHRDHCGVILLRLSGLSVKLKIEVTLEAIEAHPSELLGSFVVISPGAVRIRRR